MINSSKKRLNDDPKPEIPFKSCLLTNASSCPISEVEKNFIVNVYNPLSRNVRKFVRLPVLGTGYKVVDSSGWF